MRQKRDALSLEGFDVLGEGFDFDALYSERPGAAFVIARLPGRGGTEGGRRRQVCRFACHQHCQPLRILRLAS
eukprot:2097993-Prymnesium_polylepis.1